jgi:hypothetical protein
MDNMFTRRDRGNCPERGDPPEPAITTSQNLLSQQRSR